MLKTFSIKNYALIDEIHVEFASGLNIITGETGAGKSIIIGALSLILGERASADVVRKGADKAIVEGVFTISDHKKLKTLHQENEIDFTNDLILRREVSSKGQSRCFINDTPATLSLLNDVGNLLVDLHGQHEHQSLLRIETHIDMLDDVGGLDGLVSEFRASYERLRGLFSQLSELQQKEQLLKEKRDLYEFQLKEINAVNPRLGEEDELNAELKILENAERLYEVTSRLYQMLYEGENSTHDQLVLARNQLEDLARIDKAFDEAKSECSSAEAIVDELTKFIQSYNSKIEFNPEKLEHLRERLGQLSLLKKKYGGSIESIVAHRDKISREFALAENFDAEIQKIKLAIEEERQRCSAIAQRLSTKRREIAKRVNKSVVGALAELDIPNGKFETKIESRAITEEGYVRLGKDFYETAPKGIDFVEFLISTNIGEDVKPLARVASGGEISRIMLALKTILAKSERLPVLIFDEIDVGVSGRIAQAVGLSLKNLSSFHQIIAITHLPQIAGLTDTHFVVEKIEDGKRTFTKMRTLTFEERVHEVAKLMSGAEITEAGLEGARELMGLDVNIKKGFPHGQKRIS